MVVESFSIASHSICAYVLFWLMGKFAPCVQSCWGLSQNALSPIAERDTLRRTPHFVHVGLIIWTVVGAVVFARKSGKFAFLRHTNRGWTTGVILQIRNATILANQLSPIDTLEGFQQWKIQYKRVVGAMHIWCWRNSLMMTAWISLLVLGILAHFSNFVSIFVGFQKYRAFLGHASVWDYTLGELVHIAMTSIILFLILIFVSLVDSRYRRFRVLLATKEIQECGSTISRCCTTRRRPTRLRRAHPHTVRGLRPQLFVFTVMVGIYTAVLAEYR